MIAGGADHEDTMSTSDALVDAARRAREQAVADFSGFRVGAAPPMGVFFIGKAFITVISGGHMPLLGTISASGLFGAIDGIVAYVSSSVIGEMTVLFVAIILLRLLPLGITGRFRRGI